MTGDKTASLTEAEKDRLEELMVWHGFSDLPLTDANTESAVHSVIVGEDLVSRTKALNAVTEGMNTISLGCLARSNPCLRGILFPTPHGMNIDVGLLKERMALDPSTELDTEEKKRTYE